MSSTEPSLLSPVILIAGAMLFYLWWKDTRENTRSGKPVPGSLPGAAPARAAVVVISILGALFLVGLETGGEIALGITHEQTRVSWLFLGSMMGAAVIEEVVFRGYLIVLGRGRFLMILSVAGFSLLFALIHPYLWEVRIDPSWPSWAVWRHELGLRADTKTLFTTGFLFLNSLWFYSMRILPWNTHRSLLPCFAAHLSSNLGVFIVKAWQGFVVWPF